VPTFTVVAGPNGSGKSTLTRIGRVGFQSEPVLDPDAVANAQANTTNNSGSLLDAGREVLNNAESLLQSHQSFLIETTLSGHTYL
jgi:predicted ABC-type ATPase